MLVITAGGTASGKSSVAYAVRERLGPDKDGSHTTFEGLPASLSLTKQGQGGGAEPLSLARYSLALTTEP